jgi:hypothetical protein
VRGVCVEEASAIGAEVLDDFQRGHRPLSNDLAGSIERMGDDVVVEVHRNSLADEEQRPEERAGRENPEEAAGEIDPEVTQGLETFAGEASDEGDADGQAHRAGEKILYAEAHHLAGIAHGVFARIGLPGAGGGEADGCVEGEIRSEGGGEVLRKEPRKEPLGSEDEVEDQRADKAEDDETGCVLAGGHFRCRIDAGEAIDPSFHWSPYGIQHRSSPGEDALHVTAERPDTEREDHDEEKILHRVIQVHRRATGSPKVNTG